MKKILVVILAAVMLFTFVGCGKTIKLTKENYETYLKINTSKYMDNHEFLTYESRHNIPGYPDVFGVYEKCNLTVYSEGVSQNFNYNEVKIKAKITVEYLKVGDNDAEYSVDHYIDPFLDGYGTETYIVELNADISGCCESEAFELDFGDFYSFYEAVSTEIEILEISGTVTPV